MCVCVYILYMHSVPVYSVYTYVSRAVFIYLILLYIIVGVR